MLSHRATLMVSIVVLLFTGQVSFGSGFPEHIVGGAEYRVQDGFLPEADTFTVDTQCSDVDLSVGGCCLFDAVPCASTEQEFAAEDVALLNTYWNETIDCTAGDCSDWSAVWSLAIQAGGGLVFLFQNEPVSFGDVTEFDGLTLTFCVFSGLQLPAFDEALTLPWGFGVETPLDPFQVGALGDINIHIFTNKCSVGM